MIRWIVVVVLLLAASAGVLPVLAQGAAEGAPAAVDMTIVGHWTGAKLRCQKDEGKMVRCGTPAPFEVTFAADGTGETPDENLPKEFTWFWQNPTEISMAPKGGGKEIKLFAVEHEDESILSFQAYVFLPPDDPAAPAEVRYIHYVFDVSRAD